MPLIIEIQNLTHRFADGTLGLDGVTLVIEEGAFVVIAGANGSGKTTLLRHLNGLLLPDLRHGRAWPGSRSRTTRGGPGCWWA